MEIVDAFEALVKNPFTDISSLDPFLDEDLSEYYKKSDFHMLRKIINRSEIFSDMSHVVPFTDMSHVLPLTV
jgi:hypothetical protein